MTQITPSSVFSHFPQIMSGRARMSAGRGDGLTCNFARMLKQSTPFVEIMSGRACMSAGATYHNLGKMEKKTRWGNLCHKFV